MRDDETRRAYYLVPQNIIFDEVTVIRALSLVCNRKYYSFIRSRKCTKSYRTNGFAELIRFGVTTILSL